jgi:catechol 2,3-dioxygenase-like lactoylglutathione lyase family enzyme
MEQRLSVITVGVKDLARSRRFYVEGLGWTPAGEGEDVVFFQAGGLVVCLFAGLPEDAGVDAASRPGGLLALAHNVRTRDEVDALMAEAERAGATVTRPAHDAFWGGRTGYFADPDGHLWEIAWNPSWPIDAEGRVQFRAPG